MKRVKSKIITTLLAVTMVFSLTACVEKPCEHTYDNACDTICNKCSVERTITHTPNEDDGDCTTDITCSECGTVTTEANENHTFERYVDNGYGTHSHICENCDYVDTERKQIHTVNSTTGICSVCNAFAAAVSITVGSEKTYYATLDEAIVYANNNNDTVIVIENDCGKMDASWKFISGSVTIDLNGKTISNMTGTHSLSIDGATVRICDSVGGGKTLGMVSGWSGTLIIEGGTHSSVLSPESLIITSGEFASVSVTIDKTATISGGSFEQIGVYSGMGTLADILADGYCFYDSERNVLDVSQIELDESWYYVYNVTVGAIQQS